MREKLPFVFRKVDEQCYSVELYGVHLGDVENGGLDFWSWVRWHISGDRKEYSIGGVCMSAKKYYGYRTRYAAARELAVMRSGKLLSEMTV